MTKALRNPKLENVTSADVIEYRLYGKFIKGTVLTSSHIGKTQFITLKNVKTNLKDNDTMGDIIITRLHSKDTDERNLWKLQIV